MSKKKLSNQEKQMRRMKEISLAASNTPLFPSTQKTDIPPVQAKQIEKNSEKYKLPIGEIKKDVAKNIGYTVFVMVLLVIMQKTGFGYQEFRALLRF